MLVSKGSLSLMNENNPFQEMPSYLEPPSKKPRLFMIIGGIALVVILAGIGLFLLGSRNKDSQISPVPQNQTEPTSTVSETSSGVFEKPSPAQAKKLDKSELKVVVLNGSGIPGAAKGISSYLNSLGYSMSGTDNADNYLYKDLSVRLKRTKSDFAPLLKKDLEAKASGSAVTVTLVDEASADAEVIVGK